METNVMKQVYGMGSQTKDDGKPFYDEEDMAVFAVLDSDDEENGETEKSSAEPKVGGAEQQAH